MILYKIIFLDIDGVLNSNRSFIALKDCDVSELDPIAVGMLQELVKRTNAEIVISSTWRLGKDLNYFRSIFAQYDWKDFPIIGMTPNLRNHGRSVWRGEEVQAWITEFEKDRICKIKKYICLDDDGDFEPSIPLVQTCGKNGFSFENFQIALHLLDPENNPIAPLARKN